MSWELLAHGTEPSTPMRSRRSAINKRKHTRIKRPGISFPHPQEGIGLWAPISFDRKCPVADTTWALHTLEYVCRPAGIVHPDSMKRKNMACIWHYIDEAQTGQDWGAWGPCCLSGYQWSAIQKRPRWVSATCKQVCDISSDVLLLVVDGEFEFWKNTLSRSRRSYYFQRWREFLVKPNDSQEDASHDRNNLLRCRQGTPPSDTGYQHLLHPLKHSREKKELELSWLWHCCAFYHACM